MNYMSNWSRGSEEFGCRVVIFLASLNGTEFLKEQLASFEVQTHKNWCVWASDDGSHDDTAEIIEDWCSKVGKSRACLLQGPGKGYVANFQSMISDNLIRGDYFAFSDQDDVWLDDKLERAITYLRTVTADVPAIYCSRTEIIDCNGARTGALSPLFSSSPSFANALVQSIAGGNTMVLNRPARDLMAQYSNLTPVSHDWWAYQLVTGVGGRVIYDTKPSIYYRQHGGNLIGNNQSMLARFNRLKMIMDGNFAAWNDVNLVCLDHARPSLTPESISLLNKFEAIRSEKLTKRIFFAMNNPFYRQTLFGNIGMLAAFILGKF